MMKICKYTTMKKVAIIIKHPGRDFDYRIEIINVKNSITEDYIYTKIKNNLLSPFEIVAITQNINIHKDEFSIDNS